MAHCRGVRRDAGRVVVAFVLAMLGGGALGYLTGRSARVNAWVDPWVVIGLNLPVLVVIVLAYIWIGLNDVAAVLAVYWRTPQQLS